MYYVASSLSVQLDPQILADLIEFEEILSPSFGFKMGPRRFDLGLQKGINNLPVSRLRDRKVLYPRDCVIEKDEKPIENLHPKWRTPLRFA